MTRKSVDKFFLVIVLVLAGVGFLIFLSAALGLHAEGPGSFGSVLLKQFSIGIVGGLTAMYIGMRTPYRTWRKYALPFFVFTLLLTLLVFIPGVGMEHGGAKRWLSIGSFSFQPAELLKLGFVIYLAAWVSGVRTKIHHLSYGLGPLLVLLGIVGLVLFFQPDTGTFLVIAATGVSMFIASGAKWKHFFVLLGVLLLTLCILVFMKPYLQDRILTFFDPHKDILGSSYQVQQSLIAVGSGGVLGRGFGQSIQKFSFLPEPIGDSIFAVAAEEFGFVGSTLIIILFVLFAWRGLVIGARAPDYFGRLLAVGIVILIVSQSFINIASMLGIFPLTGMPLLFISHGGSALLVTLFEAGILLNISRKTR